MMHPRPRFVFRFFGVLAGTWLAVSAAGAEPVVRFVLPPPPVAPGPEVEESAPEPVVEILAPAAEPLADAQPVTNWLEAQVELARRGFSSGSIDGVGGAQSAADVLNKLNVPVWSLEQDGHLFVRTFTPRLCRPSVDVVEGGTRKESLPAKLKGIDVGEFYEEID
jgi:hypothetical protein